MCLKLGGGFSDGEACVLTGASVVALAVHRDRIAFVRICSGRFEKVREASSISCS